MWAHFVARRKWNTNDEEEEEDRRRENNKMDGGFCSTVSLCFNTEEIHQKDQVECKYWDPRKMAGMFKVTTNKEWRGKGIAR